MAIVRDVIESIINRRCGPNPGSDLFATVNSYARTTAEIAAGVTPVDYSYPPANAVRYGADPTGSIDSAPAINTAIKVLNNITVYTGSGTIGNPNGHSPDLARGGTVFIPQGTYLVKSPILGAPFVTLEGAASVNQSGLDFSNAYLTIIKADYSAGVSGASNGAYVVDTGNWRQLDEITGTPVTPYRVIDAVDQFYQGLDKDNAVGTWCPGFSILNMVIDCNHSAFGGIRQQCASNFRIDGVVVINSSFCALATLGSYEFAIGAFKAEAPIGWWAATCESAMQDAGELWLSGAASTQWTAASQTLVNNVFYIYAVRGVPNCGIVNAAAWYNKSTKAMLCAFCENFTVGFMFLAAGTVGIECMESNLNILHCEQEFTGSVIFLVRTVSRIVVDGFKQKDGIPLCTGDGESLIIRQPHMLSFSTSFTPFNGETSSSMEVEIWNPRANPDQIEGTTARYSNINLTRIYPYGGSNVPTNIWVSDAAGTATLDGFQSGSPTTLNGALQWIVNNPHILAWTVLLKDAATHIVSSAYTLANTRVQFQRDFSGASLPTLKTTTPLGIDRCKIILTNMGMSGWSSPAAFTCTGQVDFEIDAAGISIPNSCAIWQSAVNTSARIQATGQGGSFTFGTSAGLCSGGTNGFMNYEDSFAGAGTSGTAALEAITTGKVKKIASNIV